MFYPHGFKSKQKFENYLRCLNNIKEDSLLQFSLSNHIDGILHGSCSVVYIKNEPIYYGYGCGNSELFNKSITLTIDKKEGDKDYYHYGYSFNELGSNLRNRIEDKLGRISKTKRYLFVNSGTLITKIYNGKRVAALGVPHFGPYTQNYNLTIKFGLI